MKFGSSAAASFTVDSDTRITAVNPAGSLGYVHVTITTPKATSALSAADRFLYGASDDQPVSATLSIRPTTLNTGSKGVFTVYVTRGSDDSPFPVDGSGKPRVDFGGSYLACSGAGMIRSVVSNRNGGTGTAGYEEDKNSEEKDNCPERSSPRMHYGPESAACSAFHRTSCHYVLLITR